ncbi:M1 family aminopeptidase [Tundrisphaera sp. TA3]|uniref:M1 family metallopeptidase n=1 Tax=Tundrisphaera sp. TA3 TaxID=3435775 RepID=UPI003EB6D125
MLQRRRWIAWLIPAIGFALGCPAFADEPGPRTRLKVPPGLPRYAIEARLDIPGRRVEARERVVFTNRTNVELSELVFHVYPRHRVAEADRLKTGKTLEVLRLSPEEAMDAEGRRLTVDSATIAGKPAVVAFDPSNDTIMAVPLPAPVKPGETATVEIAFVVDLPDFWGRWGHHKGVTYLLNWYPVLAHVDDRGWERTPFVPWHQPWHQEAGHYSVRFDLPEDQVVASTGRIVDTDAAGPGRKAITIEAAPSRDFAFVCSNRFESLEKKSGPTTIRVVGFPEDRANAEAALTYMGEVIPLYEEWFGPYYDEEFEIATSFFGWNGNECAGLVLIDDRVMKLPEAGTRYLDHLVTHETLHQWFWNVVGTDGYAETFMDEGIVNGVTARRLDEKYGRNAPIVTWGKYLNWMPTIGREDMRLSGYYGWKARGGGGSAIRNLGELSDLGSLFSLAYDRGGKVINMVENRLGPDRFFAFFRQVYQQYAFGTFHYAELKRDLAAFDPGTDWPRFLDDWLVEHKDTDWAVERVDVGYAAPGSPSRPVVIRLRQRGELIEPTVVACRAGESELRIPIWPDRGSYDVPDAHVNREGDTWTVTLNAPDRPTQVEVDPDHALLDAVPDNNRWKGEIAWRVTPLMTPLDQASTFQAFDRPSVVAGLFVDQYQRGGFKVAVTRLQKYQLTAWAGTEPALREAIFGGQFQFLHFPWPRWNAGVFYEQGLYNFYNDKQHSGGRIFARNRFLESASNLTEDAGFYEFYYGFGNEFWQGDDGRPVDKPFAAVGARFRLNTLYPVWNPEGGRLIDATVEYGDRAIGSTFDYVRMSLEYGIVRSLPANWGYLSRTRIAVRGYGGLGFPDNVPYFRLGGGRRLRALDLQQNIGSSVWLGTVEWRFPLCSDLEYRALDRFVGLRNVLGTVFYDVGQSYLQGEFSPVVHGVGFGIGVDVALFSFIERAVARIDIAQPIGTGNGPVLWFGLNQSF